MLERTERLAVGASDHLRQSIMIAQIDKQYPTVIALPMDPARQLHLLPDFGCAQFGAGMGAIGVHSGPAFRLKSGRLAGASASTGKSTLSREEPVAMRPPMQIHSLISSSDALLALCERLAGSDFVAVDTEFMRENTY